MLVYYITSHGYGHAVRSCEIIRNLPVDIPLTVRTAVPESFLRRELEGRPFEYQHAAFDCGTLGPDSTQIDLELTIATAEALLDVNERRLAEEVALLRQVGARLVIADVPPFALHAARAAGIPSVLVANFIWPDIFSFAAAHAPNPISRKLLDRTQDVCSRLQAQYDEGDLLLTTGFCMDFRACRAREDLPLVTRSGQARREALARGMGLDPDRPIYLLYLGVDGFQGLDWSRLDRGLQLVSYVPPAGSGGRVLPIPEALIRHADAASSVDAVIAKPGYGICGECVAAGTPLLWLPRPDFAETPAMAQDLETWGGAMPFEREDFANLRWDRYIDRIPQLRAAIKPMDTSGGAACAARLAGIWRSGRLPDVMHHQCTF